MIKELTIKKTIEIKADNPLPELLVKKIVKARIEENKAKKKIKKSNKWIIYITIWSKVQ